MTATSVTKRPKLRRLSRRTVWQCRVAWHRTEERFRHAGTMRVAAQAVALHHFGIPLRRITYEPRRGRATLDAAWHSLTFAIRDATIEARDALERDCIAILSGIVARAFALGWEYTTSGGHDQELVCDLLDRVEYDEALRTSWHFYLLERARDFVQEPAHWTQIELLAERLCAEYVVDGPRVADVLAHRPRGVIVPARINWQQPEAPQHADVVVVGKPAGLTDIVARTSARRNAEEGDEG